jgi:hypothetical protein
MYWFRDSITSLWLAITFSKKRIFFAGLSAAIVVAAVVMLLPLKTVTEEKTETYYETEFRQETYPVSEAYESQELVTRSLKLAEGNYTVVPFGIVIPFKVEQESARITGDFENSIPGKFSITTIGDRVIWEMKGTKGTVDVGLPAGEYNAVFREDVMWGEDCTINLKLLWSEYGTVTRYRTVDTVKSVPVMVEKQKLVTESFNVPFWKYLFSNG